jgi:hypothetical protein
MTALPHRAGLYFALLQLFFTLSWTVYAIYLPKLAASAGIAAGTVIWLLILDQAIFTVADFASGVAADRISKVVGRLGFWVGAATALSCAAFVALPFVAAAGAPVFIALSVVWAVTSSALRAPPLTLLGKYAAKPAIPYLSSLAMLGMGIASALAPYLGLTLRDIDPRIPFVLSSLSVVLTAFSLAFVERRLAGGSPSKASQRSPGRLGKQAAFFALALIVLALGYQLHFAINTPPLFLKFAMPADLPWLTPVFWVGFNIAMFPATLAVKRFGHYQVMAASALVGAAAIAAAALADSLGAEVAAQFAAGGAWGCILMSAFTLAFAIGNGAEGAMVGLLFSTLAIATVARMAAVALHLPADPAVRRVIAWAPTICWILAGAALLVAAAPALRRFAGATRG